MTVSTDWRENEAVHDDVQFELSADATLCGLNIIIRVKDGMVTISGDVSNWAEYKEAARVASFTNGTRGVINRLRVIDVNYPWTQY